MGDDKDFEPLELVSDAWDEDDEEGPLIRDWADLGALALVAILAGGGALLVFAAAFVVFR